MKIECGKVERKSEVNVKSSQEKVQCGKFECSKEKSEDLKYEDGIKGGGIVAY